MRRVEVVPTAALTGLQRAWPVEQGTRAPWRPGRAREAGGRGRGLGSDPHDVRLGPEVGADALDVVDISGQHGLRGRWAEPSNVRS
jgi:hypothetical protein